MVELSFILTLSCIFLPIFFYPIPYISPFWIPQPFFIRFCQLRIFFLFFFFTLYNFFQQRKPFFSSSRIAILGGLFFFVTGQILNRSVYQLLGTKGVYYGTQYGTVKPLKLRTDTFPFCLKHPLYIGGCLSYLGILLITFVKQDGIDESILFLWYNAEMVQFSLMLMENIFDSIY